MTQPYILHFRGPHVKNISTRYYNRTLPRVKYSHERRSNHGQQAIHISVGGRAARQTAKAVLEEGFVVTVRDHLVSSV